MFTTVDGRGRLVVIFAKNHRYQSFRTELLSRVCRCLGVEARLKQFFILKEAFHATRRKQYQQAKESGDGRGDGGRESRRDARPQGKQGWRESCRIEARGNCHCATRREGRSARRKPGHGKESRWSARWDSGWRSRWSSRWVARGSARRAQ